ncbi:MAG: DUF393 domain-containing protein [Chlamydiia bacterium]|nr:DUF393 domain-containing protein [Chlamydiia bacterium]
MSGKHLVFYDGECGFCDQVVQFLLRQDKKKIFVFAPLQGKTAGRLLKDLPENVKSADSVILIENYDSKDPRLYLYSKAVFRVMWLLGGVWTLLGWRAFLPAFFYDWGYRLVARNRKRFFSNDRCVVPSPEQKERFLP